MVIKSGGEFDVAQPSGSAFVQFSKLAFGIWEDVNEGTASATMPIKMVIRNFIIYCSVLLLTSSFSTAKLLSSGIALPRSTF